MSTPVKSISKDLFAQAGRLSKWENAALWIATGILIIDFLLGDRKQQISHWDSVLVMQALLLAAYSFLTLGSSIVMAEARKVKINDVVDNAFGTDHVLTLPMEQLQEKGKEARQWVLRNKNNYLQAKRINDLLGK